MTVDKIFTGQRSLEFQVEHAHVNVVAGAGIEGDRYFGRHDSPGQNITLVEAEEIESFLAEYGRPHDLSITNRNIVTRGVRLNELVGKEFMIGGVRLRGVGLCEPCRTLGKSLASPELSTAAVVKRFLHRAGLRADVLTSGVITCGDRITIAMPLR